MIKSILPNIAKAAINNSQQPTIKKHFEHRILKTHPKHLFQIITNVDLYHQFLPFCTSSKILRHSPCGTMFDASLSVGLNSLVSEEYVSRVKVHPDLYVVESKSIKSSALDSLSSRWTLKEVSPRDYDSDFNNARGNIHGQSPPYSANDEDATKWSEVKFEVQMTVTDPIIKLALDQVWDKVAQGQVNAFEKRCHELPFSQSN